MNSEKMSVSLESTLIEFVMHYQKAHQIRSKSEVIARALTLLREHELETQYAAALEEWQASGEADLWDAVTSDGLNGETNAAR
ncbi:type II toxin-antitoxin system ParD family antitoxin [Deinococcus arcticus]|uniref:Antitoxin n=1 Tax=Deinococcus arcticus TaxID=2136176 RepID=A0A2T3W3C4_9DEIO|nr:type II toxin-antitoxin system ParD family antitoxin [Deinococcus arcticus]PTA66377.1 antitoxin [Deinococcus arcticus]